MPLYTYKVKNEAGKILAGEINIENEFELTDLLIEKGYTPVEIKVKNAVTDITQISLFKKKVKVKDLAIFCRQFAIVLEAGIPIANSLDVLREQTQNPTLREILNDIYENIQKGVSLSASLSKHKNVFPELLINMAEAGEISGQLDLVFKRLAENFEKDTKLNSKIKGAMMYPIIICVIAVAVVFVMMTFVLPTFTSVLKDMGAKLPMITQILIAVSDFFVKFWYLILGVIIALVYATKTYLKSYNGKRLLSNLAISLPVLKGVTKNVITARFARTLGTLIASGVLLIQAMEVVQKILGNVIIAEKIDGVIDEIKKGRGLTQPLSSLKYFPPMVVSMVRIGEESGDLDFALNKSADFFDEEVEASIQRLTSLLEPLIIVLLAGVVGVILISVLYPMMTVYQSVG